MWKKEENVTAGREHDFDRICVLVHLDRIRQNMKSMKENLPEGTKIIGVVKADGYGCGAGETARAADPYAAAFAAATADEALSLRREGILKPVLVLGSVPKERFYELLAADIRPVIFEEEMAAAFSEIASQAGILGKIHLAVDTGMSRIGFQPGEQALEEIRRISQMKGIEIEACSPILPGQTSLTSSGQSGSFRSSGIFPPPYRSFWRRRNQAGKAVLPLLKQRRNRGFPPDAERLGDERSQGRDRHVRPVPVRKVDHSRVRLLPVMEFKSRITYIKEIPSGTAVSYGGTFTADRPMRIATVSAGYADGYPRGASGKGEVLIRGKRARILGRVCMDQLMADVTDIPEAEKWDEVTLVGRDGQEEITMEELADVSGGFHYELPCLIGKRVPRIYTWGNQGQNTLI